MRSRQTKVDGRPRVEIRVDGKWFELPISVSANARGAFQASLPSVGMPMLTDPELMHLRTADKAWRYNMLRNRWDKVGK